MKHPVEVGIKELKNRLSAYLREVRQGRRVLVTDRGEVVAELHRAREADSRERIWATWIDAGAVVPAALEKRPLPPPLVRLPEGTSRGILDELRGG